jgi:DNA-directed RNA polymerase specialized sigma24 family protein
MRFSHAAGKAHPEVLCEMESAAPRILPVETKTLREALGQFSSVQRAVSVLRSVLGLEEELVGEIVEIPMQEVRRIGMKALIELREVLPREFSPGRAK